MPVIEFFVPGLPVGQPRAKATSAGGRTRMYTPTTLKQSDGSKKPHPIVLFKAMVRTASHNAMVAAGLSKAEGPVTCEITASFPRKSRPKWLEKGSYWEAAWKSGGAVPHTPKPDRDNMEKACLDAMKDIVFCDDKQVWDGPVRKFIAAKDESVGVRFRISW